MGKNIRITATAFLAAALGILPAGTAGAAQGQQARPDLDGDGSPDLAVLTPYRDGGQQLLRFTVDGDTSSAVITEAPEVGVQPMRVVDVNGDGRQEVVITEAVGANTDRFVLADLGERGVRAVTTGGHETFRFHEGGGVSARLGYQCGATADGRAFTVLRAQLDPAPAQTYSGSRIGYEIRDGIAHQVSEQPVRHVTAGDPLLRTDPATCA